MMRTGLSFLMATLLATLVGCVGAAPGDPGAPGAGPGGIDVSEAALSDNAHTAFNYFVTQGLTEVQAAGIVGNLMQESSVSPTSVEYGGGPGRGIAQWSVGGRWDSSSHDNMTWYASQHGESRTALGPQLDFIWYELTTYGYGYSQLKAATTVTAAVQAFQDKFEICGACDSSNRIHYAQQALADYGSGSSSGSSGGGGTSGGSGSGNTGADCYSGTLGMNMPENACVQSMYDDLWYQCSGGSWVDRWTDPDACNGVYPL
jgi:hypothetical protein